SGLGNNGASFPLALLGDGGVDGFTESLTAIVAEYPDRPVRAVPISVEGGILSCLALYLPPPLRIPRIVRLLRGHYGHWCGVKHGAVWEIFVYLIAQSFRAVRIFFNYRHRLRIPCGHLASAAHDAAVRPFPLRPQYRVDLDGAVLGIDRRVVAGVLRISGRGNHHVVLPDFVCD